jgi:hypothetical protein
MRIRRQPEEVVCRGLLLADIALAGLDLGLLEHQVAPRVELLRLLSSYDACLIR